MHGWGNSCAISYCLSSSRENTISRRGLKRPSTVRTHSRPNEPVPPVISIDLSSNIVAPCSFPLTLLQTLRVGPYALDLSAQLLVFAGFPLQEPQRHLSLALHA